MNLRQKRSFVGMSSGTMLLVRGVDTQPHVVIIDDRTEMIHETRCSLLISGRLLTNGRFGLSVDRAAAGILLRISST